ncbi:MAG: hypothetical protein L3J04_09520, partial [Robiginitomaculum sp.]|nr:hypothetical protein [Robiginitomaculum sp.]
RFSFTQVFEELGRVLSSIGANNQTTSFAWNRVDMMSGFTDPNGGNTVQVYDNLDRLKTQTDAISAATTASYSDSGLENVTDPGGLVTAYVRNGWGEIIREVSPDAGITDYELNTNGQIIKRTDARGQITNYTYDAANRLTSEEFVGNSAQNIDYIWDIGGDRGIGRITQIYDEHGITDLFYDARGEIYKEIRSQNSQVYETVYADDGTNAVIGMTYPSGRIVEYARDNAGRITDIRTRENASAIWQDVLGNMDYLPFGPLTTGAFGNSLALNINYDLDYQITAIKVGAGSIVDLNYNHDANGNVTALSDNAMPARDQVFTYDAVDRLVNASGVYGAIGYSYDLTGNRLSRTINTGSTITENYNYAAGSNKLITVTGNGGRTIGWNAAGQANSDIKAAENYLYSHDAEGRTRTVTRNGSLIATYGYDATNRRVVKSLTGQTIHYIYDRDDQLIAEYDGISGSVLREYVWLGLMPLAIIDHTNGSPVLNFLHSDHLGRPIAATDNNGLQVWDGTFTPFGEAVLTAGSLSLELRFPGQYRDSETELYYNFTRIYDPSLGRYLQYDTIGLGGGINPFAYVGGNPVGLIDPRGEVVFVPILAGAVIGLGIDLVFQLANNGGKWNCLNKGSLLLSAALGGAGGGGGAVILRNATKKYGPVGTPREWSHFLPKRLVDKFRSARTRNALDERGGLNGNWVTAQRHHLHDFWRRPKGSKVADKWPLPLQLADRVPNWAKAATLAPLGSQIKRFFQTPQTCECQK